MDMANFVYRDKTGAIYGYISDQGVRELVPCGKNASRPRMTARCNPRVADLLTASLRRYFSGEPESFEDIPLDLDGHTAFRRQVWRVARGVGWGKTTSYGGLCAMMGRNKQSARAVGQALSANPIPIIIPCHRILAGDGTLGGFSCGLDWKVRLLRVERHCFP